MRNPSLTLRTEMFYWRAGGEVLDRGDYWLIRSPTNPTYYFGNLLYFHRPPGDGDYERWLKLFQQEFEDSPQVKHILFIWDAPEGEPGELKPFADAGFDVQSNVTLATGKVVPPVTLNKEINVRRVVSDDQWEEVLASKIRLRDPRFDLETYTPFKKRWLELRRELAERGLGNWYGAYIGDRLVGDLGLFRDGNVGRFQDVGTDVEFRRRGICGTLVHEVSKQALESGDVETLVMIADQNYHAAKIYESVGFKPAGWHVSACRYPI